MMPLPRFQTKKEFIILTLNEYEKITLTMLNMMHQDGWTVSEVNKELKLVLIEK